MAVVAARLWPPSLLHLRDVDVTKTSDHVVDAEPQPRRLADQPDGARRLMLMIPRAGRPRLSRSPWNLSVAVR